MKMVPPKRGLSESSLTSVADMIQDAFGDESESIVDFGFIKAILLVITRALSLLERKVAVKLYPTQHIPQDNSITIGEIKVSVKGRKKTKRSSTDMLANEAIKQKFSEGSDMANVSKALYQYDQDSFLSKDPSYISKPQSIKEKEIKSHKKSLNQTKSSIAGTKFYKNENCISTCCMTEKKYVKNLQSSDKSEKKEPSPDFNTHKIGTMSEKEGLKQTENLRPSNKSEKKETSKESDKSGIVSENEDSAQTNDLRSGVKSVKTESSPGNKFDDEALSKTNKAASEGTHKEESDREVMSIAPLPTFLKKVQEGKVNIGKSTNPSDSAETYHEKIFVVRRVTTESNPFRGTTMVDQAPQSLVTKERFKLLEEKVKQLQHRLSPIYSDLLPSFHRASSLSDPIAVLQLSARLEAIENAIYDMMEVLKKLHSTRSNLSLTNYNLPPTTDHKLPLTTYSLPSIIYELPTTEQSKGNLKIIAEKTVKNNLSLFLDIKVLETDQVEALKLPDTQTILSNEYSRSSKDSKGSRASRKYKTHLSPIVSVVEFESSLLVASKARSKDTDNDNSNRTNDPSFLTYEELRYLMQKFADAMNKQVQRVTDPITLKSQKNIQDALILGVQQANIINKQQLLQDLEIEVKGFTNSVNKIETELNDKVMKKQLSNLNNLKADRDETEEALKCKVSKALLNGLIDKDHFLAMSGHWEKYVTDLVQHFDCRERGWQKRIDLMWTNIDVRADTVHVNALFDDIYKNIAILDEDLDFMINVCKVRPGSKNKKKIIKHKEPCISCGLPPKGTPEELLENHPKNSRSTNSLKAHKRSIGNIENKICYLNLPMPHPIEARPPCSRPCVSHKRSTDKEGLDSSITVQSSKRKETQETNKDMKPCKECVFSTLKKPVLSLSDHKENEQPKTRIYSPIKSKRQSHVFQKSKESLASERSILNPKIKRGSVASERSKVSRIRLNLSRGRICTDSDSILSEDGNKVIIVNLDEDVSLQW